MEDNHESRSTVSLSDQAPHSPEEILRGVRVPCVHAYTVNNEELSQPLTCTYSLALSTCHTYTFSRFFLRKTDRTKHGFREIESSAYD